jgi:hypothetical protein
MVWLLQLRWKMVKVSSIKVEDGKVSPIKGEFGKVSPIKVEDRLVL